MVKKYISPIRFFKHVDVDPSNAEAITATRLKKLVNVEFAQVADGFITVDDAVYNKQDILEEIERPNFSERLEHHKKIWESPATLSMLEKMECKFDLVAVEFKQFQNDEQFDAFISPYFAEPFSYAIKQSIERNNMLEAGNWLAYEPFIQNEDREYAFKSSRVFLDESERLFKNLSAANYDTFRAKMKHFLKPGFAHFLNNLPDELYAYKDDFSVDLINITVFLQKPQLRDAKMISSELTKLTGLSKERYDTIFNNDKVFRKSSGGSGGSSGGGGYGWIIWVVIIIIRILASGGCN